MTQTITKPEMIDIPIGLVAMPDCPAFCNHTCETWDDGEGNSHHVSDDFTVTTSGGRPGAKVDLYVCVSRTDQDYEAGAPEVNIIPDHLANGSAMTAAEARKLAATLLNAADLADPIPNDVLVVAASSVRLGDAVLTEDGWQNVVGQMAFVETDTSHGQVNVWTDERDPETEGWLFDPADPVKVRRPMHGGDAVLNSVQRPALSAVGWCSRCAADRVIVGTRVVSARGVIRVRGRCQTCDKGNQRAFAGLTSWAEDNQ